VGFSAKPAVLVLVVGAPLVGAFSLHRLHGQIRICNYRNWRAPCRTSGIHADWTDISALGVVVGAAVAAGVIGSKRKASAARGEELSKTALARERRVGDELRRQYRKAPDNLAQNMFLATMSVVMREGTPLLEAEERVVESLRKTYPDFTPLRQ
jgi:hypothetical protein